MATGSGAIRAGQAFVELLVGDKGLKGGLDRAGQRLEKWAAGVNAVGIRMLAAGTAIVAPLAAASKVFATMGDELAKASTRTGVSVEKLSALKYAADQSGSSLEGLEGGLRKMSKFVVEAAKGSDTARGTLRNLGLTFDDLKSLSPDEQFVAIAEALSKVQNPTVKAALAMEVFGKGATELIPLMDGGAAGINELTQRAKELGLTWTTKDAKAAEEFGDRLDDLWHVMKRGVAIVGSAVVPIFRQAAVLMTDVAVRAGAWINAHQEVVRIALAVGAAVAASGVAFLILGKGLSIVGGVVGGIGSALGLFTSLLGTAAKIISTVLLSGVGLLIAGLAGLAVYFLYNSQVGQQTLAAIGEYFQTLKATATEALGGIRDALAAGDWALAAQILWLGIKTAFAQGIQPLKDLWYSFRKYFVEVAVGAFDGMLAAFEIARTGLTEGFIAMTSKLSQVWTAFASGLKEEWEGFNDIMSRFWNEVGVGGLDEAGKNEAAHLADQQHEANVRGNNQQELANAKAALDAEKAASDAERKRSADRMAQIGQHFNDTKGGADAKQLEDRAKDAAELARLQGDLAAATKKANIEAKNAPELKLPTKPKIPSPDDLAAGLDGLVKKTVSVPGIFNSAAIQGLQSGSPVDRIAKATEQTAKNTKNLGEFGRGGRFS